jgi:4-amino-4-deoxy-L-arabinose transferase-like glycosyltransferase
MFFRTPGALVSAHTSLIVRVLVIFGLALLFRMSAWYYNAATDSGEYLFNDAGSFYRTAVHLANGDGYVQEPGQEPVFFREPVTSYFFAGSIALYATLAGRSVVDPGNRNAIRLIRLSQAVLQAVALALFYLLLRHYFRDAFSFTVAALASLYPPLALYSEQLMRENLLVAVLMAVAYLLSSHIQRPAYWKLAVLGILWGVAALTLQVYMLLGVLLFASLLLRTGRIALALRRCAVIGALFVLTVLPWIYKVYAFYPNVRIAQSLGCALTPDWIQFKTSLQFARSRSQSLSGTGGVPADAMLAVDPYGFTTRELFDNAFSGHFRRAARQLDLKYGHPSLRDRVRTYVGALAWFLVLPGYQYGDWSAMRSVAPHDHGNMVVTMFISIVLSVMSIIGIWTCCRRATGVLPIYLFHLAFFWLLMSESRRALPIVPFFVLFGMIGLWKVIQLGFPQCRFSILKES